MAQPIAFDVPQRDAKRELMAKLENAPQEHAAALLDLYALVQSLHDHHVFETARGVIGAGAKIIETAASAAEAPEAVAAVRNVILLGKTLGAIDPELLRCFAVAAQETLGKKNASTSEPPGLLSLAGQLRKPEIRRSVALVSRFLDALGQQMSKRETTADSAPRE